MPSTRLISRLCEWDGKTQLPEDEDNDPAGGAIPTTGVVWSAESLFGFR